MPKLECLECQVNIYLISMKSEIDTRNLFEEAHEGHTLFWRIICENPHDVLNSEIIEETEEL